MLFFSRGVWIFKNQANNNLVVRRMKIHQSGTGLVQDNAKKCSLVWSRAVLTGDVG